MGILIDQLRQAPRRLWAARACSLTAILTPVADPERLDRIGGGDACCVQGGRRSARTTQAWCG